MKCLWIFVFLSIISISYENICKTSKIYENLLLGERYKKKIQPIALVLARKGSKGIINKNLQIINGISLIGRTLIQIINSKIFQEVWVSTDSEEIAKETKKFGAYVHRRPSELARDETPSISAVKNFIENRDYVQDIALFQCTSVFLKVEYIKDAIKKFQSVDCVFSVKKSFALRWTYDEKNGFLKPLNFNLKSRPRRQDWSGELIETGMFYFAKRKLIEMGTFQNERCAVVIIDAKDSLEIDELHDLNLARCLIEQNSLNNSFVV